MTVVPGRDRDGSRESEMERDIVDDPDVHGEWSPAPMIVRLGDDEDLARQLAGIFATEYPGMMAAVHESVARGCAESIRVAAHALKGCAANFTDEAPTTTAFELEQIGREGRAADAPAVVERLAREVDTLARALSSFARGPS